jgi:hypothetical protein
MKSRILILLFCCLLASAVAQEPEVRRAEPVEPAVPVGPAEPLTTPPLAQEQSQAVNEAARFIAGLPPTEPGLLADWAQFPEWIAFSQAIDKSWQKFEDKHIAPIRLWKPSNVPDLNPDTVFYPFSGPDFIYAEAFFPNATTYILCGLEPTGTVPSLQNLQPLQSTLGWMQVSVKTLMDAGYFITKEMQADLKQSPLQGTVPVFCFMLARNGDRIVSVQTEGNHAEIRFLAPGDSRVRTLHYFSLNLRNDGLRKENAFLEFVKAAHPDVGYLKSASYLMHESDFSTIRDTLLTQCRTIVQDDSGIPLRCFNPERWRFLNFGVYAPTLDIFKKYNQPEMADLYAKLPAAPLPFGVGYHWDPKTANLMVFTAIRNR